MQLDMRTRIKHMTLKSLFLASIIFYTNIAGAQDWIFCEKTSIRGSVSGSITKGYLFKTTNGTCYEIVERTRQRVRERNPDVTIYKKGDDYKLDIEGFDEPVICRKIKDVIESMIDG